MSTRHFPADSDDRPALPHPRRSEAYAIVVPRRPLLRRTVWAVAPGRADRLDGTSTFIAECETEAEARAVALHISYRQVGAPGNGRRTLAAIVERHGVWSRS